MIVKQHPNNNDNMRKLVDKVTKGGSGVWGNRGMPPQSHLQEEEIAKMVKYNNKICPGFLNIKKKLYVAISIINSVSRMHESIIIKVLVFFGIFFSCITLKPCAQTTTVYKDIFLKESPEELIFGNESLLLKFNRQNGSLQAITFGREDVLSLSADQLSQTIDFIIDDENKIEKHGASFLKYNVQVDPMHKGASINLHYGISTNAGGDNEYELVCRFMLAPQQASIKRSAGLTRLDKEAQASVQRFKGFDFKLPNLKIGNIENCTFDVPGPFFPTTFVSPETPVSKLSGKTLQFHNAPDAGFGILSLTNKNEGITLAGWMETRGEVTYVPSISNIGKTIDFSFFNERSYLLKVNQSVASDPQHIEIGASLPEVLLAYRKMCESHMPLDTDTPDDISEMVLMEVYPDYFIDGFKGITKKLPFYKEIGINTIYLMPHWSGGYGPIDFYEVDPKYGTEEDLKDLVKKAHSLGLRFFFDMVIHGFNVRSPVPQKHPELFVYDEEGELVRHPVWKSITTDWASPAYQDYMAALALHHAKTYGIDGYRLDAATYKGPNWDPRLPYPAYRSGSAAPELMKRMLEAMHTVKPDAVMLSEVFGPVFYTVSNLVHDNQAEAPQILLEKIQAGEYNARDYKLHMRNVQLALPKGANRVYYTRNHDTSWFYHFNGYTPLFMAMEALHALCAIPEIFSGDPKSDHNPDDDKKTFEYYKSIFSLRKQFPELSKGQLLLQEVEGNNDVVFSALRELLDKRSLVAISLSGKEEHVEISLAPGLKAVQKDLKLIDGVSGKPVKFQVNGKSISLKLKPYQVVVGRI